MSMVRSLRIPAIIAASCFTFGVTSFAMGDDWPTFRGPGRTGVAVDSKLLTAWPEKGPKLVWETKGAGRGYASVAVAGDKLYTLGDALSTKNDEEEYLTAFDVKSGK